MSVSLEPVAAPVLAAPERPSAAPGGPREQSSWRASLGRHWRLDLAFMAAILVALGALKPLADPDLPMHLALGDWIVRHRTLPVTEPFAWTRAGEPFFAYSWIVQVPTYLAYAALGPLGLRLLQGLLIGAAGASMFALGRAARWQPGVTLSMAAFNIIVATFAVPVLRPQLLLLGLVPLSWALVYHVLRAERLRWALLALVAANAIAVNTHLFFPLMAAPLALFWIYPPRERRRMWLAAGATVVGWLLSPYLLQWPAIFQLNFAPNALLRAPSPISELQPGFDAIKGSLLLPVLVLALLPWALRGAGLTWREQLAAAALWLVGLVGFAHALRLLLVWWLLVVPAAAWAVGRVARGRHGPPARPLVKAVFYAGCVLALAAQVISNREAWAFEGVTGSRRLASKPGAMVEPLAGWLAEHTRPGSGGRIYTVFNAGSYLTWRLPGYSVSIDGRTIFPDSVAAFEGYVAASDPPVDPGPWRAAHLAIVPTSYHVTRMLDSAAGWRRAAAAVAPKVSADTVVLWVTRSWWDRAGRAPLPADTVVLYESERLFQPRPRAVRYR